MDNASPLKTWVRRHSPLKSRNKPLPPAPQNESPARIPGEPVSGNVSPPKLRGSNKFLSLLKPKPRDSALLAIPADTTPRTPIHKRHFRSTKGRTPDLHTLSRKVSNLEVQLREARRELDAVVGVSSSPSKASPQPDSDEIDRQIQVRQETLSQRGRYDGLVEHLLGQRDASLRPVTRRGPVEGANVWQQYTIAEDAYEPVQVDVERPQTRQLKRKHEEATWQEMQERIAEFQKLQQPPLPSNAKRARQSLDPPAYNPARVQRSKTVSGPSVEGIKEVDIGSSSSFEDEPGDEPFEVHVPPRRTSSHNASHTETLSSLRLKETCHKKSGKKDVERGTGKEITEEQDAGSIKSKADSQAKKRLSQVQVPGRLTRLSKVDEEFEWNDEEIF